MAKTLTNLANAEGDLGNAASKKRLLERTLKIKEGFYGQDRPEVAITLFNLGVAERDLDGFVAAKMTLERAAQIFDTCFGQSHPHTVKSRKVLSELKMQQAVADSFL